VNVSTAAATTAAAGKSTAASSVMDAAHIAMGSALKIRKTDLFI
jgi:hypothetical protein